MADMQAVLDTMEAMLYFADGIFPSKSGGHKQAQQQQQQQQHHQQQQQQQQQQQSTLYTGNTPVSPGRGHYSSAQLALQSGGVPPPPPNNAGAAAPQQHAAQQHSRIPARPDVTYEQLPKPGILLFRCLCVFCVLLADDRSIDRSVQTKVIKFNINKCCHNRKQPTHTSNYRHNIPTLHTGETMSICRPIRQRQQPQ
jgi:hypothetical protein